MLSKYRVFRSLFSRLNLLPAPITLALLLLASTTLGADPVIDLTIRADRPGARINPNMWGIFFEDINYGADGGLYAELVKNRSFEFPNPLMGWSKAESASDSGNINIREENPFDPANPHYLRLEANSASPFGVANEGYFGMGIREGEEYLFSAQVRAVSGTPAIQLELRAPTGKVLAQAKVEGCNSQWQKLTASLTANATEPKARLYLLLDGAGAVDLDMVSLFPKHTWKNRPGGLRQDMVQMLADLKPGFLRFPGGCIVEGKVLENRYQWKTTIGPIEKRKLILNRWNNEFRHRPAPDYFQSFGLGFFEYFQLCEDIGAEPLPILNCGMACQFNSGQLAPAEQMDSFVQDALDLIEFANGPLNSPWGAKRAEMGHPAPFRLKMLGIGNEQWGPEYLKRYVLFAKVLKQRHPEIQLITSAGPSPADDRFHFLAPRLRDLKSDIVDEHCYATPIWFLSHSDRYDKYDRKGPKIFMGEYAAQSVAIASPNNRNNLECALAEAAYMTGLERNADVVRIVSYAPLFAHAEGWQWRPDLIWVDNLRVHATPNYYVQQLFMHHRGDTVLPVSFRSPLAEVKPTGRIGLGTSQTAAEFKDVRVTSGKETLRAWDFLNNSDGWSGGKTWTAQVGVYRQADPRGSSFTYAGEDTWGDYTLSLKARKVSGSEGFLIKVRSLGPEDYIVWNLGGWHNEYHGLVSRLAQQDHLITRVEGKIETGRWYDIKVALRGTRVECYLDGKLVHRVDIPTRRTPQFFASAARDEQTGEIILKAVNPGNQPAQVDIKLRGVKHVSSTASSVVLTGKPADENSFDAPQHVVPVSETISNSSSQFHHTFKPHSFTVLRIGNATRR